MYKYYEYIDSEGERLYTAVLLPEKGGKFPTVIKRNCYVDHLIDLTEDEVLEQYDDQNLAKHGYALVIQHCRGCGKSSGDCVPYIHEREDGLALRAWIREQDFYNGQLLLSGGSYLSSVHFTTAPFEKDIVGAVLRVQDCERYNCNYRNGFYKVGLHGGWYVGMYKRNKRIAKSYTGDSYNMLPLSDFSKTVFGESVPDFDEILKHPKKDDPFWTSTRYGGAEAHNAIKNANIPILLETGFYDIYTGGIFDMWKGLSEETKKKCALVVNPYAHGGAKTDSPIEFPNGEVGEAFKSSEADWFDAVLGKREFPYELGKVTYYRLFENKWVTDDFEEGKNTKRFTIGEGEKTYVYNPFAPAHFSGGLSTNFGGAKFQAPPNSRYDILSYYTEEFSEDTFIKGKMKARLTVKSDCEDTCFYVRISLAKEEGDYGLRDDISSVCNFKPDYIPGEYIEMDFSFDEHAFLVKRGERLRIDISSSAANLYVRHTNNKGLFSEQTTARVAHNTVVLDKSYFEICTE